MEIVKKRGWIKNVAIIFLIVMLVLTFFSNHIMNRSLPEVAAQYASSGTITARIRGTGSVEANEVFEVRYPQTREVEQVRVRLGTEVETGDLLIVLSGADSKELEEAKANLHEKEIELEKFLIEMTRPDSALSSSNLELQNARNALAEAQKEQADIPYDEAALHRAQTAAGQSQAAEDAAKHAANASQLAVNIAQIELGALIDPEDGGDPDIYALAQARLIDAQIVNEMTKTAAANASDTNAARKAELAEHEKNQSDWILANAKVRQAQNALEDLIAANSDVQGGVSVDNSLEAIKLRELRHNIDELKEKIERLESESSSAEITSAVNGIVTEINVRSGTTIDDPDMVLMVIEVVDLGYSLSFSVTTDQARRVNIGDQAEVDRGWWSWGEEIRAILVGIGNDPDDPRTRRMLHFSISGDIESGDVLNLTLAQRSENYGVIVPNSAIRTDTNGDFVLVVMSSSGPLGNRFIATRVDVNIIATDDTNTAVTGGLQGWDFVITTATRPIEPGMQIRLVDNP